MSVLLEDGANRLEAADDTLTVVGSADFEGASALAEAGRRWLEGRGRGERVTFDMSGVDRVSSAAVSVLLEWLRQARRTGLEVAEVRLSAPLARLTDVADLDSLLPVVAPAEAGA
ncbi:STAS domain-containing protein [Halomonas elongata]|uniref:STAS domain protein n=1 Tax=Halomonas elongata (strain ATCC 33173 / DSM 2581 / NBRC 15536 / NCIMB 2198 / 1H9) TaxID=768066 RepID=E1V9I3_HALED|nr:STAS domain-containing protein [Halomonas elongata]MBW5798524.1 STAS domain-containing protein [Halomonas elongata]MDL4863190.1 STAS domain-containing protein [Halomonas elongata]RAW07181.1 anti-sigma factor antagonist [Halomonas elongata]WBF19061.1 STAS domain-containing protein [Halomonas elongata]WPU47920.1 STAS domain-containing protein [Halomonas elongata DSM 2581]